MSAESLTECEITTKYNIFNRYHHNITEHIVPEKFHYDRTYEGAANYLIVFAPLHNHKDSSDDIHKIERYLRGRTKYDRIIITKEVKSERIHYNVLITSKMNLISMHGKINNTFYMNVQHVKNITDLPKVVYYIYKESKEREFKESRDHIIYCKK